MIATQVPDSDKGRRRWTVTPWVAGTFAFGVPMALLNDASPLVRFLISACVGLSVYLGVRWRVRRVDRAPLVILPEYREVAAQVRNDIVKEFKPDDRGGVGWPQFFEAGAAPSTLGTAYGLKLVASLNPKNNDVDPERAVEYLFLQQKEDHGWASSSQGPRSRVESTATVLSALAPFASSDERFRRGTERLETLVAEPDRLSRSDLTAVSAIVLMYAARREELHGISGTLAQTLRDGQEADGSWAVRMDHGQPGSVAHTARAVVALRRYLKLRHDEQIQARVRSASTWLVDRIERSGSEALATREEGVRRLGQHGVLLLCHFTPAWVLRALGGQADLDGRAGAVAIAQRELIRYRSGNEWRWPGADEQPIWMAYQALKALSEGK